MAKKFPEASTYLNKQRIVGRVLDLLLLGYISDKARESLKQSCEVGFEMAPNALKNYKDLAKPYYRYHKWALVTTIL
jgi:hypothetical protein